MTHCQTTACGGDDARHHTAGRAGNTYNSHHTESTVDVLCTAAARYRSLEWGRGRTFLCHCPPAALCPC